MTHDARYGDVIRGMVFELLDQVYDGAAIVDLRVVNGRVTVSAVSDADGAVAPVQSVSAESLKVARKAVADVVKARTFKTYGPTYVWPKLITLTRVGGA